MNEVDGSQAGGGFLKLKIDDKQELYRCYMPFVENGGFFIATTKDYAMGDELFLVLSLFDDNDKLAVPAKVVWLAPKGASNHPQGVGVQFRDEGQVRDVIETHLAGMLESDLSTHTI